MADSDLCRAAQTLPYPSHRPSTIAGDLTLENLRHVAGTVGCDRLMTELSNAVADNLSPQGQLALENSGSRYGDAPACAYAIRPARPHCATSRFSSFAFFTA